MSATSRVLTGLGLGALIGLVLAWSDPALAVHIADIAQPVGKLWLNALQMTVVPLVLALVIVGVNTASDAAASGRVARRSIEVFLLVLTAGVVFTAIVAPLALSVVPRQVVAASTQSSLASLPAMLQSAEQRLGYPTRISALVLPMAVSLFRVASPIQYMASACFIAWAFGIDLSVTQLATGAALAVVISLG